MSTPIGIFAKTFAGTPEAVLGQARAAGYDCVQYNMACSGLGPLPAIVDDDTLGALRRARDASGVGLVALSATYNMIHPDVATRAAGHHALVQLVGVAHALSIPVVTVCTGSRHATDPWAHHPDNASVGAWRDLVTSLHGALDAIGDAPVLLGIEPEPGNVIGTAALARRLLDELQSSRLGVVFDLANLLDRHSLGSPEAQARVVNDALDHIGDRVVLVHAKDRNLAGDVVPAGQGVVDFGMLFTTLQRARIAVPVITHGLDAAHAAEAATYLHQFV